MLFRYPLRDPFTMNNWNKLVVSNTSNGPFAFKLSVTFTSGYRPFLAIDQFPPFYSNKLL